MVEYSKVQSAPRVSIPGAGIIIMMATYNGADTLGRTLDALTRVQSPDGGWKLVIIDDGSSDDSRCMVTSFMGRLPLTLIECNHGGKNAALNAGLSAIEGDLVVFIDDDVLPDEDWLLTFRDIADREPGYAIFGGDIRPDWEREPPAWVCDIIRPGPVWGLVERDEARILLFDEPTSALDPEMIGEVLETMTGLAESGMTMLCVTHEMGFARQVANRILFMDEGRIVEGNDPAGFFGHPRSERLQTFLRQVLSH